MAKTALPRSRPAIKVKTPAADETMWRRSLVVDRLRAMGKYNSGPLRRMRAEVVFLDPDYLNDALSTFTELGFEAVYLPERIDECGPAVIIRITIATRLDDDNFPLLVAAIVDQIGECRDGDLLEWGEER
jgi:hypothetical protein